MKPAARNPAAPHPAAASALGMPPRRIELETEIAARFAERDYRGSVAPLCRLVLALPARDSERAVVFACLAIAYAEIGRPTRAEAAVHSAWRAASTKRGRKAAEMAATSLGIDLRSTE